MYVSLDYLRAEMGDCGGIRLVWSYYGSWSSMKLLQEGYWGSRRATDAFQGVGIRPLRQLRRQGKNAWRRGRKRGSEKGLVGEERVPD